MNGNKVLTWGLVILILIVGIIAWAMYGGGSSTTFNNVNTGTPSPSPTGTLPTAKSPGLPTAVTKSVTYISQSSAVLNGDVNPNGAQTTFWYEYGTTNTALSSNSPTQVVGGGYVTYTAPTSVSNLKPNTIYYYRIVSQNQFGKNQGVVASFTTTNVAPSPVVAPTAETKAATDITADSATLNGSTNPKGVVTYYWFEYGTSTDLGESTVLGNAVSGTSTTSISGDISNLEANTKYYYRVNVQNGYGIKNGSIMSFTTKAE